jgi:hypothetical protein
MAGTPGSSNGQPAFVRLPVVVLRASALSAEARLIYALLMYYQRDDPYSFPKVSTLAADLGCSERTTRRAIGELTSAGLLIVTPVSGFVSHYTIAAPVAPPPAKSARGPRTEAPGGPAKRARGVRPKAPGDPGQKRHPT